MEKEKSACIAFLGNALHDSRITNLSRSLINDGFNVTKICFDWQTEGPLLSNEDTTIYKLKKGKFSLSFYLKFSFLLLKHLFKTNSQIYFAEDIYTLPFVSFYSKLKKRKIFYNSRELYMHIGGLRNRKYLQAVITQIEKYFIKKVDLVLTTGEMDSAYLEKFYNIKNTFVIRNIPVLKKSDRKMDLRESLGIPKEKLIMLYQGVLFLGRGIPLIINAMKHLPDTVLVLLGDGEQKDNFKSLSERAGVSNRIYFMGNIIQDELINYTAAADLGLSLIENISISYYHALPNKLFEYIMAGLPVLVSDLPQMKQIVETYKVGEAISLETQDNIINSISKWMNNRELLLEYSSNCKEAAKVLNWQEEYKKFRSVLNELI